MSRHLGWRLSAVFAVLAAGVVLAVSRPARLGLDLRGGTQIVLEAQPTRERRVDRDTLARTVEVLRRRVDQLGVAEPTLQASGERRVIVELPGVSDPREALRVIGRTAQLGFHPVVDALPEGQQAPGEGLVARSREGETYSLAERAVVGDDVKTARATYLAETGSGWAVEVDFRGAGADRFEELTGRSACSPPGSPQRRVAIVLDQEVISAPEVGGELSCGNGIGGGRTVISGAFTQREAEDLALLIRAGALPVPVEVVEQRTIGPTLGAAAIAASVKAAVIGAALTILYMLVYYRLLGAIAAVVLVCYALLSYAALLAIGATLTLPGVAGFVLAVGVALDANVLVFERIKEEHAAGRTLRSAARNGFQRAWSAIADSNATTVIAAALLFFLASGAVRGFGVTLTVGVAVSMFTALVVTRVFVDLLSRFRNLEARPRLMGVRVGGRMRASFEARPFDIVGRRRLWFLISGLVLAAAVAGLGLRGLRFGVEFTGGQLVEYATSRPVDVNRLRGELAAAGFPRAVVHESGEGNVALRTPRLSDDDDRRVTAAVRTVAGDATRVRSEFVGPTIGAELRRKALVALGLALAAQLLYLAVRFRWTYGASAVAAMFHDVLLLIGVFAWLGKEIDGVFLAALLTVIGYSVNDSVVVFDRVREERRLHPRDPVGGVVNRACLRTIPRTINTGLGALFILLALYLLGGETLTDFALALLIGIAVGTYSSIFAAAPLAAVLEGSRREPEPRARPGSRAR